MRVRNRAWAWVATGLCATALAASGAPLNSTVYLLPVAVALVLAFGQAAAIPLAMVTPRLSAALAVGSSFLFISASTGAAAAPWPFSVTNLLALCATLMVLALSAPWYLTVTTWVLSVFGGIAAAALNSSAARESGDAIASVIVFASIAAVSGAIGLLLRGRATIRAQLLEERRLSAEAESSRALVEERNRIARELHDVIAHNMSVIQVQASSATYRIPELPDAAAHEFAELATTARQALAEMRQVLQVLRGTESAQLRPLPGIEQIPELIDNAVRASVPATLSDRLEVPVHEAASLTAYRVVQEALSNVIRHAPGAATSVELLSSSESLTVRVENVPGNPPEPRPQTGGHGLVGMRERIALVNGTLETGATPGGGFLVLATIPLGGRA